MSEAPEHWRRRAEHAPHNYDRSPSIALPDGTRLATADHLWTDLAAIAERRAGTEAPRIAVDCYPGVELDDLRAAIAAALPTWRIVDVEDAALPSARLEALLAPLLTDDRVFGRMSHLMLPELYDPAALAALRADVDVDDSPVLVLGWGATLAAPDAHAIALADVARWEIQRRLRAGRASWRADDGDGDMLRKFKRGYFVEWRVADRHKRALLERIDMLIDANRPSMHATAIGGDALRTALAGAATRPFRVVPYFDPGVWGGHWMETVLDLEEATGNYAWCFDCVPEENSLLLRDEVGTALEIPAMDLVLGEPRALLGERTYARFGAEFPIRFDFLDTMGGGNLSLQVHPLTDYMQQTFGMPYTQDESYYMLDAEPGAVVYLGLREGIEPQRMLDALAAAQDGGPEFPAEDFVNVIPVERHDHVTIPAGTVHCSGAGSMVLEISATPYIFTFKLWDWGRLGLDGRPRPVHLEHGARSIQWDRDTSWVHDNLVGQVDVLHDEPGHREERTGLHELEFIEVRRHWFEQRISLDTRGTVHVLNLVEGAEATIESPTGAFAPFPVHYAETCIVPADVGAFDLVPSTGRHGIVVASVRGTHRDGPEVPTVATTGRGR